MGVTCANGSEPVLTQTSYVMSKSEFQGIFGGGNDTVVTDFYHIDGRTETTYTLESNFCSLDLGDYEDISNFDILLILVGQTPLTVLVLTQTYLKIISNVRRYLQAVLVCQCRVIDEPEPMPLDPLDQPQPPEPPPPGQECCESCFAPIREAAYGASFESYNNLQGYLNEGFVVRSSVTALDTIPFPIPWESTECSVNGNVCQYFIISGGVLLGVPEPTEFTQPDFPLGGLNRIVLTRSSCGEVEPPVEEPPPVPTPVPLPPDTFDFCDEFPALCNVCPDVGNASNVVISGQIPTDCGELSDVSYKILFAE